MDTEIERLHHAIDGMTQAVGRQSDRFDALAERQAIEYRDLLQKQTDSYDKLLDRQDRHSKAYTERLDVLAERQTVEFRELLQKQNDNHGRLIERQDIHSKSYADRLDKLVSRVDEQAKDILKEFAAVRDSMRMDFSRLVDRQDSHFRWLFGLMAASAITLASLIYKSMHP